MAINFFNSLAVGTNVLYVDTLNDRVGIGTSSPDTGTNLHVLTGTGSGQIKLSSQANTQFQFHGDGNQDINYGRPANFPDPGGSAIGQIRYSHGSNYMAFKVNNAEMVRFASNNNVGIGTTSPSYKLDVNGTLGVTGLATFSDQIQINDSGVQARLNLNNTGTGDPQINFQLGGSSYFTIGVDNSDSNKFKISDGSALGISDRIVVDLSGNTGIGTTSPSQKLHVSGNVTADRYYGNGSTAYYLDPNDTSVSIRVAGFVDAGPDAAFRCYDGSNFRGGIGDGQWASGNTSYTNDLAIYASNNFNLHAGSNTPLIRVTNTGLVGIGTTTPTRLFHVAGASASAIMTLQRTNGNSGGSYGALQWTASDDHTVATIDARADGDNEGAHLLFHTTSAASSNDPYGINERMRITSTGNVGIGTSSPGYKLDVQGQIRLKNPNHQVIFHDTDSGVDEWSITTYSNTGLSFFDGATTGSAVMTLLSGGNVGIGLTNPGHKLDISGTGRASNDFRAPIFYDTNDTNYYLDANSTSRINQINYTRLDAPSSTNDARWQNHSSWGSLHQTTDGYIQLGPANTNHAHIYTDRSNFYFNKQIQLLGGSLINQSDIRSNVFYDLNNTNYYVDPASTGLAAYLRGDIEIINEQPLLELNDYTATSQTNLNAWVSFQYNGTEAGYVGYGSDANSNLYLSNYSGSVLITGASAETDNSFRAPVFYDKDDTGYYVDPNSTSQSARLRGQIYIGPNTSSKYLRLGGNGGATDASTISTSNGNLHIDATTGYNLYLAWYNTSDVMIGGQVQATRYYDRNNTGYYVDPASTSVMNDISNGSSNGAISYGYDVSSIANTIGVSNWFRSSGDTGWYNGTYGGGIRMIDTTWVRTYGTKKFYVDNTGVDAIYTAGGVRALTQMKAPIFYDENNTSYYTNPAGTSTILDLTTAGFFQQPTNDEYFVTSGKQVTSVNDAWSMNISTSKNVGLQTFRFQNAVTGAPSTNDNANWGINIYSHSGSGGNNPYGVQLAGGNNDDQALYLRRFSNGAAQTWRKIWHEGSSNIQATTSVRAPIFYDSNNTGYYVDPANVNVLNRVVAGTTSTSNNGSSMHVSGLGSGLNPYVHFAGSNSGYGGIGVRFNNLAYGYGAEFIRSGPYDGSAIRFMYQSSQVGRITINTTSTSYLTTSDYRLKENVIELTNGIERVKQLQPKRFNFIGDEETVDGFIAHEAEEVVPESVSGEKDEVLPNGEPVYQGIDQAKLVPLLTAALQEAITKIEDLETRIQILENQ